jgi:cholesterol oxidase
MACRLAQAGQSVLVLERGKPYPPGSFPRDPYGFRHNFWDPSRRHYGLFNIWSFRNFGAVVSSGLGGGSLIYANVLLRKDEQWFGTRVDGQWHPWPVTRHALEPYYDTVERMLGAQHYPLESAPYDQTPKTLEFRRAALALGIPDTGTAAGPADQPCWFRPKLAVAFAPAPGLPAVPGQLIQEDPHTPNLHRRSRLTCQLCGECDAGCNYGSKNTLDYNYLSVAQRAGAELRTLCEVKQIKRREDGLFEIGYTLHRPADEATPRVEQSVLARRVVLAAGALGSTYLLLRNRQHLPGLSPRLGDRFCGNGDLLGFAYNCTDKTRGPRLMEPNQAPVITSTIRQPDGSDGAEGPGFYLQDAGYPAFLSWMAEMLNFGGVSHRLWQFLQARVRSWFQRDPQTDISGEFGDLIGDCRLTATMMPLLGMGMETALGVMQLGRPRRDGPAYLEIRWEGKAASSYYQRLNGLAGQICASLGARYVRNPETRYLNRYITVHPLGGCPLGTSPADGVVNAWGEVFNCPGLYVADGAVMPGPVGANPSLTIAALAESFAAHILDTPQHP